MARVGPAIEGLARTEVCLSCSPYLVPYPRMASESKGALAKPSKGGHTDAETVFRWSFWVPARSGE